MVIQVSDDPEGKSGSRAEQACHGVWADVCFGCKLVGDKLPPSTHFIFSSMCEDVFATLTARNGAFDMEMLVKMKLGVCPRDWAVHTRLKMIGSRSMDMFPDVAKGAKRRGPRKNTGSLNDRKDDRT